MRKIEILTKKLQKIAPNVKEKDKLEAALHLACSYKTVNRYLKGNVSKPAFAEKLYNFLNEKIAA
jgi:hypothetical protein